jgi:hypothetical protein
MADMTTGMLTGVGLICRCTFEGKLKKKGAPRRAPFFFPSSH